MTGSTSEPVIRIAVFIGVFLTVAVLETLLPKRPKVLPRRLRWSANLGLSVINTAVLRLVFPISVISTAITAEALGWGLFPHLNLPLWVAVPAAIIILDLAIYLQHRLFHAVPLLWRLHRVHHADTELDVSSGIRFHPLEILLSTLIKIGIVMALGAPPVAVLAFELLLNATSMFNHANVRLPAPFGRLLRLFIVTPDMHRVHHSARLEETNSNFGFNLPWWDRLFGTYRAQPIDGHDQMIVGLEHFRDPVEFKLSRLLLQPTRKPGD